MKYKLMSCVSHLHNLILDSSSCMLISHYFKKFVSFLKIDHITFFDTLNYLHLKSCGMRAWGSLLLFIRMQTQILRQESDRTFYMMKAFATGMSETFDNVHGVPIK